MSDEPSHKQTESVRTELSPLPRGMSPGFYAFMTPGCLRDDTGGLLMTIERPAEETEPE